MSYKRWLLVAASLFGIGLVLGLATPATIAGLLDEDVAALEELAEFLATLPQSLVLVIILIKNASVLLMSFVFSPIFCLVPVMALTFNGWLLGLVATTVIQEKSLGYLLAGLLPHGIFELPALILGEAVALSFGTAVLLALFKKERRNLLLPNLRQNLRWLAVALVLLLPAAIIETYLTPLFLN
ncbi:stage II sporulation protein M [Chloroflexota bacterium]